MTSGDQEVSCQGVPYNNEDTLIVGYLCLQEVNDFQFNIDSIIPYFLDIFSPSNFICPCRVFAALVTMSELILTLE